VPPLYPKIQIFQRINLSLPRQPCSWDYQWAHWRQRPILTGEYDANNIIHTLIKSWSPRSVNVAFPYLGSNGLTMSRPLRYQNQHLYYSGHVVKCIGFQASPIFVKSSWAFQSDHIGKKLLFQQSSLATASYGHPDNSYISSQCYFSYGFACNGGKFLKCAERCECSGDIYGSGFEIEIHHRGFNIPGIVLARQSMEPLSMFIFKTIEHYTAFPDQ